jgi:methyl-accepting chemotaxis protein
VDFVELNHVIGFLSKAAQADLTSKLVIVGVVWQVMGRKVSGHFHDMEKAVRDVAAEVRELRETVKNDLKEQANRIGQVKSDLEAVNHRVERLELKGV